MKNHIYVCYFDMLDVCVKCIFRLDNDSCIITEAEHIGQSNFYAGSGAYEIPVEFCPLGSTAEELKEYWYKCS